MSSVNESNAYQRGKREGYDIGHTAGSTEMMAKAKKEGMAVRWMKLLIAAVIGFTIAMVAEANAQVPGSPGAVAQTSVTVVIPVAVTAEVACNPENEGHSEICLQEDEPAVIESVEPEQSLWSSVLQWIQKIFT